MALPNPSMVFTPFDQLPASDLNKMVANDEYLETKKVTNDMLDTTTGDIGGAWQDWTPTMSGWSSNPANGIYKYTKVGKTVTLHIAQPTNGTSNAATCSFTLPFNAVTRTNERWTAPGELVDNGVAQVTPTMGIISSGGSIVTFAKDYQFNVQTSSGGKRISSFTISYEIA